MSNLKYQYEQFICYILNVKLKRKRTNIKCLNIWITLGKYKISKNPPLSLIFKNFVFTSTLHLYHYWHYVATLPRKYLYCAKESSTVMLRAREYYDIFLFLRGYWVTFLFAASAYAITTCNWINELYRIQTHVSMNANNCHFRAIKNITMTKRVWWNTSSE